MDSRDPAAYGLPHRSPFVFVDEVVAVREGRSAECRKTFAASEPFFAGHFPGDPLVPGVFLAEALAQTAGIAAGCADAPRSYRLSALKQMKFLRAVRPESLITLVAEKKGEAGALVQFEVRATVEGEVVAEGVIVLNAA